jgi:hypothetical protein
MIKWFAYIVVLLLFAPCLSSAKIKNTQFYIVCNNLRISLSVNKLLTDTTKTKKQEQEDKKKIKEVAKAKKQPRPEKPVEVIPKPKPKRQRRPEGLERPPEIPRHNGN